MMFWSRRRSSGDEESTTILSLYKKAFYLGAVRVLQMITSEGMAFGFLFSKHEKGSFI